LCSYIKERLEGHNFASVNQVPDKALAQENRTKDFSNSKSDRSNIHFLSNDLDTSDNENSDVYAAKFTWSSMDKSSMCDSLKPIHKSQQEE
jgi:hypothetical protein